MNIAKGSIIFVLGAGVGAAVTWFYTKKKYEKIAQEEIDSVKETFAKIKQSDISAEKVAKAQATEEKPAIMQYANEIVKNRYTTNEEREEDDTVDATPNRPYVISPDEFGTKDDYDVITYTYYADGTLADECNDPVEDIEDTVGFESLGHFGEYEDDSVFVRNDMKKCDYEILLDERSYAVSQGLESSEEE